MIEFTEPTIGGLTTVAGLGLLVTIIVEVVLRAWAPPAQTKDRFGPLLALGTAVGLSVIGAVTQGYDVVAAILLAVTTAGTGMGIHDVVNSQTSP